MRHAAWRYLCVTSALFLAARTPSLEAQGTARPSLHSVPPAGVSAFVDVSVVPMDRERVLSHQTVVVRGGRIETMGAAGTVSIPANAQRIDGRGKYLMPGLVDMHAHFLGGTEDLGDAAGRQLALYLTAGFTTVRGLGGAPTALGLRDRIAAGSLLGPKLVVASPSINGQTARTLGDVVRLVAEAKTAGFDLIKTHGGFPDVSFYDSLMVAAKRAGLPVSGHVTPEFGLRRAMAAGQQVEHLDGFIAEILRDGAPPPPPGQVVADAGLLRMVDSVKLARLAADMARTGIWNDPTLALFATVASDETPAQMRMRPEMRYAPAASLAQYEAQKAPTLTALPSDGRRAFADTRKQIVRALHAAGAKLLIGSDSPQLFLLPGYAALQEIDAFVDAGLSPYAALEAATRNPAEYLGTSAEVGTVVPGKRADLILLEGNPLEQVSNLRRLAGVMLAGRWVDGASCDALRSEIVARIARN
ncbi:MAG: amidohydrolase [Gemmatimonadetes bacterium]|nr:amidohydrolase [Gemmatimonadota bacterium]